MRKATNIFTVCSLSFVVAFSIQAQVNPVYQRMVKNGWKYPFENGFRELTPPEIDSEFCKSMGYNDSTVANLKGAGVDVVGRWKKHSPWNSKLWTALSDCVVIGTVSKIEHPSWARPFYRSAVYVRVDSFLRNDYSLGKKQVAVMQQSGPTGTGQIAMDPREPRWTVGEHVLLFLSASQLITFTANNNMQKLYNELIDSPYVRFQLIAELPIRSDQVVINGKERGLIRIAREADSLLKLIGHPVPVYR